MDRYRVAWSAASLFALAVAGCSAAKAPPAERARGVSDATMEVRLPDGSNLSSVDWDVTGGPMMISRSGTVDVAESATIRFRVLGLPIGPGYHIHLEATSSNGTECAGDADFAIGSNLVTQ